VTLPNVRVGYVMGTGDEVPDSFRALGLTVEMLDSSVLAAGDLSLQDVIV